MLLEAFRDTIFPYLVEIGSIIFVYSLCALGYSVFRKPDFGMMVERLRNYIVAYLLIKGSFIIVNFIDKIINNMKI